MNKKYLLGLCLGFFIPQATSAYTCTNVPITIHNLTNYQLEVVRVTTSQSDINLKYSDKIKPDQTFTAKAWPTRGPGEVFFDQVSGKLEFDIWKNGQHIGMYKLEYAGVKQQDPKNKDTYYCQFLLNTNNASVESDDKNLTAFAAIDDHNKINFVLF